MKKLLVFALLASVGAVGCSSKPESAMDHICTLPDGAQVHMTPADCEKANDPSSAEWKQRQNEIAAIAKQNAQMNLGNDKLAAWAERAAEAEQKQQDNCQDQLEWRGYGDVGCY